VEERYIIEELTGDLYTKYKIKFEKEREDLYKELQGNKIEMSKLEDCILYSLTCCVNLSQMWASGDYTQRQELQNALFAEGIVYDRQKDECRSTSDNEFLSEVALISRNLGNKQNRNNNNFNPTPASAC